VERLEDRLTPAGLGIAVDFNVFVLGNATQSNTDAEGRVAIGGDANFANYGVGDRLTASAGSRDDLVVGGGLTFTNGQVYHGNLVSGSAASLSSVGLPDGTARTGMPVDFSAARARLIADSDAWAGLAANGTVADWYGSLTLTGKDAKLNVFAVSADVLARASSVTISAPAGSSVLVNVSGTAGSLRNLGMTVTGTDRGHVLFNFSAANTLKISGISVEGSVLAPDAAVDFDNGNLEGTLVAGSLSGSGEFHLAPASFDLPTLAFLTGHVFADTNNDGRQATDDAGIGGVTVTLTGTDDLGRSVSRTTITTDDGSFTFAGLRAGTYALSEKQPAGWLDGKDAAGTAGSTAGNDRVSGIVLKADQQATGYTFGELAGASLGGSVYADGDGDGVRGTGEEGIAGVTVTLVGTNDRGRAVRVSVVTGADGSYSFAGLRPGTYLVTEKQPAGYADAADTAGTAGGIVGNDTVTGVALTAGTTATGYDFGERANRAVLAGRGLLDRTGNGLSADDDAFAGVPVELVADRNGNGKLDAADGVGARTTADELGNWSFGGVKLGTYFVREVTPADHIRTAPTLSAAYMVKVADPDGTYAGLDFDNYRRPAASVLSSVHFVVNRTRTVANLAGQVKSGDTVEAVFTVAEGKTETLSLVAYTAPGASFTPATASAQRIFDLAAGTFIGGPGGTEYRLTVTVPGSFFQVDFVRGEAIDRFGPAGSNVFYAAQGRLISAANGGTMAPEKAASLAGSVFADVNNDGVRQSGEQGIADVTVRLSGFDYLGNAVARTATTAADGTYTFAGLKMAAATGYTLTETQPDGWLDGSDRAGTAGGSAGDDVLTGVRVGAGVAASGYTFGERYDQTSAVSPNQTATIGFWNGPRGQSLLKAFGGSATSTTLGDWLAATLPDLFGSKSGTNNLAGKTNAEVAAFYQGIFSRTGQKLDAQVLAVAFAVYATDSELGGDWSADYGFAVSAGGVGASVFSVGTSGSAFGVANGSTVRVLDLLRAADARTVKGVLYNGDSTLRTAANVVFAGINEAGDLV
jgi:choice-of-anchor A domain-containing protein